MSKDRKDTGDQDDPLADYGDGTHGDPLGGTDDDPLADPLAADPRRPLAGPSSDYAEQEIDDPLDEDSLADPLGECALKDLGDPLGESAEADDSVGFKKPPKKYRFKKGESGNPSGRRKGSKNLATIVREALLDRKVDVRDRGKKRRVSTLEAMILQQANKGLQGDIKSVSLMLGYYGQYVTGETQSPELDEDQHAIIETYLAKRMAKEKK